MQNFENYLCERNDTIDNAAYQLIGVLTAEDPGASLEDDPATPNWDMAIIGEVVDAVKEIIIEKVGYGVVSSSGFGDGSYVCYTHKGSDGEIDFAFVIFIDE